MKEKIIEILKDWSCSERSDTAKRVVYDKDFNEITDKIYGLIDKEEQSKKLYTAKDMLDFANICDWDGSADLDSIEWWKQYWQGKQ